MQNKTTEDLRITLLEAIDKVNGGKLSYEDAKSIIGISREILNSAKLDLIAEEQQSKGTSIPLIGRPGKILVSTTNGRK